MASTQAQAAAAIRAELKRNGIAARVQSRSASMMNAVDVTVTDLAPWTVKRISAFVGQFQAGSFDGMTDCYNYDNTNRDLPQVKYASVRANYTDGVRQRAWDWVRSYYGLEAAPESFRDAGNYYSPSMREYGDTLIHRTLSGCIKGFWQKPRVRG